MPHTLGYETAFDLQPQSYVPVPGCGRDSNVLGYNGGGKIVLRHCARVSVSTEVLSNDKTVSYLNMRQYAKLKGKLMDVDKRRRAVIINLKLLKSISAKIIYNVGKIYTL